ncbi:hypothetical protein, partial [Xenorhabdus szentirmaii]|uniref:hypothetical protein n=1 Tax=Xenorhabdus szentirmaii TaxID=290112 RepID=UPI0019CC6F55
MKVETEKVGLLKKKEVKTGNYILTKEDAQKLSKRLRGVSGIKEGLSTIERSKRLLEAQETALNEREEFINQKEMDISY